MDLSYGPEYEAFRTELRRFLEANRGRAPKPRLGFLTDPQTAAWQVFVQASVLTPLPSSHSSPSPESTFPSRQFPA